MNDGYRKQMPVIMKCRRVTRWATFTLWGLAITGCTIWQPGPLPPTPYEEQQSEIIRLQQLLADKELEISKLRAHQQDRVKELKETTNQAVRAEIKLRRFATEADVASRLAEVEVSMEVLQSRLGTERETPLQGLAQQLLETASASFKRSEYSAAADHAAQAEQLIDMLMDNQSLPGLREVPESPFKVSIPLKIKIDSNLRRKPHTRATVLNVLQKTTPVVARAYQGQWLLVQTENGNSGWVLSKLLEPR